MGFHAFWTVEHHFLEEYSHCSNPEVLYGAIAARTKNIRIGYGVRLLPKPYNHPIRTAESVAVLDLISDGRVEFGTGRSSTRAELEGFDVDPDETREMWREALGHIVGAWTEDDVPGAGQVLADGRAAARAPEAAAAAAPADVGRDVSSPDGHEEIGQRGLGLCSFTVGVPPEELAERIAMYRKGLGRVRAAGGQVRQRPARRRSRWCTARRRTREATEVAAESFEWYPKHGGALDRVGGGVAGGARHHRRPRHLQVHRRRAEARSATASWASSPSTTSATRGSAVMGDPDACIAAAKRYEAVGCDLLLCLVNPYKIPHEKVMQTIELMGKHVLPEFT